MGIVCCERFAGCDDFKVLDLQLELPSSAVCCYVFVNLHSDRMFSRWIWRGAGVGADVVDSLRCEGSLRHRLLHSRRVLCRQGIEA